MAVLLASPLLHHMLSDSSSVSPEQQFVYLQVLLAYNS
jgi:hypothetical protein